MTAAFTLMFTADEVSFIRFAARHDFGASRANKLHGLAKPILTEYQKLAILAIKNTDFTRQRGRYFTMPPGFGKTYIMAAIHTAYKQCGFNTICLTTSQLDKPLEAVLERFDSSTHSDHFCLLHHRTSHWITTLRNWMNAHENKMIQDHELASSDATHRPRRMKMVFLIDEAHLLMRPCTEKKTSQSDAPYAHDF